MCEVIATVMCTDVIIGSRAIEAVRGRRCSNGLQPQAARECHAGAPATSFAPIGVVLSTSDPLPQLHRPTPIRPTARKAASEPPATQYHTDHLNNTQSSEKTGK